MAFLKPKFKFGGSGGSGHAFLDEAEQQRNQELVRLYTSTRAGKHFQKDVVKGVEGFISVGQKQYEIANKLAEDCKKYGSDGPSVKDKLSKTTVQYGLARNKMEKERENFHRALSTLVAEPLKAMASGSPLKDARQLKQKYDRLRQDADTQATKTQTLKAKESNPEQVPKLQAAEQKLDEITLNMDTMGKNALSAMSLVESQQQNMSLQKILAMVEYERAYFQRVTSILDQLHHDIEAQVTTPALPAPALPQPQHHPSPQPAAKRFNQVVAIEDLEEEKNEKAFEEESYSMEPVVAESFHATATHDFEGEDVGELTFYVGDEVVVREVTSSGWSEGLCNGQFGWFPSTYVKKQKGGGGSRSGSNHGSSHR